MAIPEVTCYHEAGHTVLRFVRSARLDEVHLWPTDQALGHWEAMMFPGQDEKPLPYPLNIEDWVSGLAAEDIQFRERSAGAEHDLQEARNAAAACVAREHVDVHVNETIDRVRIFLSEPANWAAVQRISDGLINRVEIASKLGLQVLAEEEELRKWFKAAH